MIYRVVTYDRSTERMKGHLAVPPIILDQVKQVAGFWPQDDGLGEYLLDEQQTRQVSQLMGFHPEPERFFYYGEPYEPVGDDGFQQPY
jgi:hypothetical protein